MGLINTSFNIRGEPIVCTPYDAYKCMMGTGIDYLIIGKYVVKIFVRERTVVDAFRYLSHEIAIKALQLYLRSSKNLRPDLPKLSTYAKALRVSIAPYIMALTT